MSSSNAKQDPLKSTHVVKVSDSVRIIDEESPKEGLALVWYYVVFVFNKLIALFKAIAQVLVILYQFLCLLYQYPTCMGYAVEITVNSLLTCYRTGIWDPFEKKPTVDVKPPGTSSAGQKKEVSKSKKVA